MINGRVALLITILLEILVVSAPSSEEHDMAGTTRSTEKKTVKKAISSSGEVQYLDPQPLVRVGLLDGYDRVDFRVKGSFSITTLEGEPIFSHIKTDRRWRCKVEKATPARMVYTILAKICETEQEAEKLAASLQSRGETVRVLNVGRPIAVGGAIIHEGEKCWVIIGAYDNEEQARPYLEKYADLSDNNGFPRILRHRIEDPTGSIELYDSEYDRSAMVNLGYRIVPDSVDTEITIYEIRHGVGFHFEGAEDRVYRGVIEVRIDNNANLLALNEVHLDVYLKGVLPSEMHFSYPDEALKAQAVASRSFTLSKLASRPSNDPVDFPATVQFQVYSGVTKENDRTSRAVDETSGQVLKVGSRICEAYFSSNSGGHTESKEYWSAPGESYLTGLPIMDPKEAKKFPLDLRKEADVAKWVRSHPETYSNPRGTGIEMLDRNSRYFRWEVTYSRRELEEILKRKLGFDIGTLIDIQPLRRGVSGRIMELEILGSHRNYKMMGELNIRRVLSETTLNSSCFIVDLVMGDLGVPLEITFVGAGFGHGVGMDQTAAGVMAVKGMNYTSILSTFYKGAEIAKMW